MPQKSRWDMLKWKNTCFLSHGISHTNKKKRRNSMGNGTSQKLARKKKNIRRETQGRQLMQAWFVSSLRPVLHHPLKNTIQDSPFDDSQILPPNTRFDVRVGFVSCGAFRLSNPFLSRFYYIRGSAFQNTRVILCVAVTPACPNVGPLNLPDFRSRSHARSSTKKG